MIIKDFMFGLSTEFKNGCIEALSSPQYNEEFATREEFEAFAAKAIKDFMDQIYEEKTSSC